jgi:hypothetical protein
MRQSLPLLFAAAALGWSASTQFPLIGAFPSHVEERRFDLPLDVDSNGVPKARKEVAESRTHIVVPDFYGRLVAVTQDGGRALLWYSDSEGAVRNVVADASAVGLVVEQRPASSIITRVSR